MEQNVKGQKSVKRQLFHYFWVASLGFAADVATLYLLTEFLEVPYFISAFLGYLVGLAINFYLSEKFVFGDSHINAWIGRLGLFALVGLVGLVILQIGMWFLVEELRLDYLEAKILVTALVYVWNFLARRKIYKN